MPSKNYLDKVKQHLGRGANKTRVFADADVKGAPGDTIGPVDNKGTLLKFSPQDNKKPKQDNTPRAPSSMGEVVEPSSIDPAADIWAKQRRGEITYQEALAASKNLPAPTPVPYQGPLTRDEQIDSMVKGGNLTYQEAQALRNDPSKPVQSAPSTWQDPAKTVAPPPEEQPKPLPEQPVGAAPRPEQQQKPSYVQQVAGYMGQRGPDYGPELEGLRNAYADQIAAALYAGDVKARGQEVGADMQMQAAQQLQRDQEQAAANQRARQEYLDRLGANIEAEAHSLSQQKIDPKRFYKQQSTASNILNIISLALGGFVQGMRGGRNPAADMIQQEVEQDIAAQRDNLANNWEGMRMKHSLLAQKSQEYGSMDVAERAQVASGLQAAMLQAQAAAAKATSPVERANAQALAGALEEKAILTGLELNRRLNAYGAGGVPPAMTKDIKGAELVNLDGKLVYANSAEEASSFRKRLMAADELKQHAQTVIQLLNSLGNSPFPHPTIYGQIEAHMKMLSQSDLAEAAGGGRGGLGMMKFVTNAYAGASSLNPVARAHARSALQQFIGQTNQVRDGVRQELHGAPVVERVNDPVKQRAGVRLTGEAYDAGESQPAAPAQVGFKPAGQ